MPETQGVALGWNLAPFQGGIPPVCSLKGCKPLAQGNALGRKGNALGFGRHPLPPFPPHPAA